jgi:hypothetical protein
MRQITEQVGLVDKCVFDEIRMRNAQAPVMIEGSQGADCRDEHQKETTERAAFSGLWALRACVLRKAGENA